MDRRARVLVLGHDKPTARAAMAAYEDTHVFVPLTALTDAPAAEPSPALRRAADAAMHATPFDAVLATSESTMLSAGWLRSRWALPGPGHDACATVTNKWRMRRVLAGPGVVAPRAWLSGAFAEADDTPVGDVVVKPLSSQAGRDVRRLPAAAARAWLAGREDLWLVEEAVDVVREYHCDGVLRGGRLEWFEASAYDSPVLVAHATRRTTVLAGDDPRRAVLEAAVRAVAARIPHPDGVFHMEFLDDGETVRFGEVGLRPGGTGIAQMLQLVSGADLWGAFVASQLGLDPGGRGPRRPIDATAGLVMARTGPDGRPPLPAEQAARLPGVRHVIGGGVAHGELPRDFCQSEYLAVFSGVSRARAEELQNRIGGGGDVSGAAVAAGAVRAGTAAADAPTDAARGDARARTDVPAGPAQADAARNRIGGPGAAGDRR